MCYNCTLIEGMSFEPPVTAIMVQLVMFDCGFACVHGPALGFVMGAVPTVLS